MAGDIVSIAGVAAAGIADTVAALEVDKARPPGKPAAASLQCRSPWMYLHLTSLQELPGIPAKHWWCCPLVAAGPSPHAHAVCDPSPPMLQSLLAHAAWDPSSPMLRCLCLATGQIDPPTLAMIFVIPPRPCFETKDLFSLPQARSTLPLWP